MERTNLKINENGLKDIVGHITREVLFETLPKQDAAGNIYTSLLESKPYIVKEGLIHSYPMKNVVSALKSLFTLTTAGSKEEGNRILYFLDKGLHSCNGLISLNKYSENNTERIEIKVNKNDFNQNDFDKYLLKYGWFCSISQRLEGYDNLVRFIYEKKFDVDVTDEVIKNQYLYHICPNIYLNKINTVGLKPKVSSWNAFSNPERVYFFLKELSHEDFVLWAENFSFGKKVNHTLNDGWSLLRVDVSSLTNNPTFYLDPRMRNSVYTTDTISPENIEIVDYLPEEDIFYKNW